MRDALLLPFTEEESIVVTTDNSGAIGLKDMDEVHVPYETVAYYCFRVAVMECLSAGGQPFAVVMQNFCGEAAWTELLSGIHRGLAELELSEVKISGSTESNFSMVQSALSITVLGKKKNEDAAKRSVSFNPEEMGVAVIGTPLVGVEVIENESNVAPLALMKKLSARKDVLTWLVGSKGIFCELIRMLPEIVFNEEEMGTNIDLKKSSGPATCFIIVYPKEKFGEIKSIAGTHLHEINFHNKRIDKSEM